MNDASVGFLAGFSAIKLALNTNSATERRKKRSANFHEDDKEGLKKLPDLTGIRSSFGGGVRSLAFSSLKIKLIVLIVLL